MYILQHRETRAYIKTISTFESGNYVVYTTFKDKALRFASSVTAQEWAKKLKCYVIEEEKKNDDQ